MPMDKLPLLQNRRVLECFLHAHIGEAEPVLHEVDGQYPFQSLGKTSPGRSGWDSRAPASGSVPARKRSGPSPPETVLRVFYVYSSNQVRLLWSMIYCSSCISPYYRNRELIRGSLTSQNPVHNPCSWSITMPKETSFEYTYNY